MSEKEKSLQQIVRELKKEIKLLQSLVVKDELTGVLNRRGLMEEIGIFFNDISYLQKHPLNRRNFNINDLSVLFIDVDNFKKINDKFGHDSGDAVLRFISLELQKNIRRIDLVGRWGGDEFIVALIGMSEDAAYKKSETLRKLLGSKKVIEKRKDLKVEVSIGIASVKNSKAKTVDELINVADKAMYYAKLKNRKNCTVKHSDIKNKPERLPRINKKY